MPWSPNQVLRELPALSAIPVADVQTIAKRIIEQETNAPPLPESCDPLTNFANLSNLSLRPFLKEQVGRTYGPDGYKFGALFVPGTSEWDTSVPVTRYWPESPGTFSYAIVGRCGVYEFYGIGRGAHMLVWWPSFNRALRAWRYSCLGEDGATYSGSICCDFQMPSEHIWTMPKIICHCQIDRDPSRTTAAANANGLFWLDRQYQTKSPRLPIDYSVRCNALRQQLLPRAYSSPVQQQLERLTLPLTAMDFQMLCALAGVATSEFKTLRPQWQEWRLTPIPENIAWAPFMPIDRQVEVQCVVDFLASQQPVWSIQPLKIRPADRLGSIQLTLDLVEGERFDEVARGSLYRQTVPIYNIVSQYDWRQIDKLAVEVAKRLKSVARIW